jgi:hypothetical protein
MDEKAAGAPNVAVGSTNAPVMQSSRDVGSVTLPTWSSNASSTGAHV